MPTQQERREATKAALQVAAVEVFGTRGYAQASVNEIAAAAAVTRGALYHHFSGKGALFEAVVHDLESRLLEIVAAAARAESYPAAQLRAGCRAFIAASSKVPFRQVLLVDAPSVLGLQAFRQLDDIYFAAPMSVSVAAVWPELGGQRVTAFAGALIAANCDLAIRVATGQIEIETALSTSDSLVNAISAER